MPVNIYSVFFNLVYWATVRAPATLPILLFTSPTDKNGRRRREESGRKITWCLSIFAPAFLVTMVIYISDAV